MKKNKPTSQTFRTKHLAAAACLWLVTSPFSSAFAALVGEQPIFDSTSIVDAVNNARVEIVSYLSAGKEQLNTLFSNAFNSAFGLTPNAQVLNIALFDPNGYIFEQSPANTTPVTPYALVNDAAKKSASIKLENIIFNKDQRAQTSVLLSGMDTPTNTMDNLDAQNFLRQLSYTPDAQNKAERMIIFMGGSSPAGPIDLEELKAKKLDNSDSAKEYKIKVYSNAAIRSLLLGNLYEVFNARIPIKKLGEKSGMPNANASLAEVEQYAASRRIKNPEWYKTIDSAPSIAVQREIAFILAEMQWQLQTLHKDNEKMLQTMTAVGMINLRMSGSMSTDQKEIELKQALEGTTPKPPEQATPAQ
jgi:hypothetical protein